MARHIVIGGPVDHDGRVYLDGEEVDLPSEAAAALVAAAVVAEVKAQAATVKRGGKEPKPAAADGE